MLNRESNSVLRTRQKPLQHDIHAKARPYNHGPDRLYKCELLHLNALHVPFALRPLMLLYDVTWTSSGIAVHLKNNGRVLNRRRSRAGQCIYLRLQHFGVDPELEIHEEAEGNF